MTSLDARLAMNALLARVKREIHSSENRRAAGIEYDALVRMYPHILDQVPFDWQRILRSYAVEAGM